MSVFCSNVIFSVCQPSQTHMYTLVSSTQQARSRLLLDELREKQRRLKAEYDAMEEQLVAMEASLGVQASKQSAAEVRRTQQQKAAKVGGTKTLETVEQDDAGNVTFRYVLLVCMHLQYYNIV